MIAVIYAIEHRGEKDAKPEEGVEIITSVKNVICSLIFVIVMVVGTSSILAFTGNIELYDEEAIRTDSIRMLLLLQKDPNIAMIKQNTGISAVTAERSLIIQNMKGDRL